MRDILTAVGAQNSQGGSLRLDKRELTIRLTLFAGTLVYLSMFLRYSAVDPDEGIVLQGAQRILQGQIPYRDFFSFYTPLSYYWFALQFRIFGSSIEVARSSLVLFGAVFALITYILARRVCATKAALIAAVISGSVSLPYRFLVLHNWDSTLWTCLAVYSGLRFMETQKLKWAFLGGFLLALTGLSEQSKGFGLALGLAGGYVLLNWLAPDKPRSPAADLSAFAAGLCLPLVAVLGYFMHAHSLSAMWHGWLWPLKHYSAANHVPYGYQNWSDPVRELLFASGTLLSRTIKILAVTPCFVVPGLPIISGLLLVCWMLRARDASVSRERLRYYLFMTCIQLGLATSVVLVRPDIVHFMYLLPLFAVVLGWLLDGRDIPGKCFPAMQPILTSVVVSGFLLMAMSWSYVAWQARKHSIATRHGTIEVLHDDSVVPYLQAHTTPGERVLVYPYLPLYYYLTATSSPGRYEYLQPGMSTSGQADRLLRDMVLSPVRVVLLEPSFADKIATSWPGTSPADIWRDPVSDYILQHYRLCRILYSAEAWRFFFMVRANESCPAN